MPDLSEYLATDRGQTLPMGLVTGRIGTWTGSVHRINVFGVDYDNPAYEAGASYTTGDVVLAAKYQTNYVILFKITRL
ncbi:MAG TPA: hypothetical protein VMU51_34285 [Mycobacteriales bacterium]|nr:hypothetical protein [Mycobacteriales bacterium]